ncbi:AAA family ATPase [Zavarzinella formosa]|uniref:AAA family ATPase n=1 Tax=Zavarzinella formosa TaxID=360055 RepID=UPI0002D28774|nr:AAA family ATPase [Zavarzinella formosa]
MPTYRYPVLIVRDAAGGCSAIAIDEDHLAGFGPNAAAARDDLENFLTWHQRENAWLPATDFLEPELHTFKVNVRTEYHEKQRIFPTDMPIPVRVQCITGVQDSGQRVASIPLLGIRFTYHNADDLKNLVTRYVIQKLEGLTPEAVARCLSPAHVELSDVVVRVPRKVMAETKSPMPETLGKVGEPLGDRATRKQFPKAWEREDSLALLVRKLHDEKANVLLLGESGVGKTTLLVDAVREVERRLEQEAKEADTRPVSRRYWATSAGRIIAGMKYLGQWEERVETLIAELGEIQGVLCIDRLLDLIQTGGLGPSDSIAAFLAPYMARGEVRMVAEVSPTELDACRRLMPGLADLFQVIRVEPFNRAQALKVIDRQIEATRANLKLDVAAGVSDRIVQLFRRFMPYSVFPGQSVRFTRELLEQCKRDHKKEVTGNEVVSRFKDRTGLPEVFLRDEITLDRKNVFDWFSGQVIDQPDAVEAATSVVMTFKAGLNDPNRPLGVLLFCGPTGVGKTELAQALARYFYGHGDDASAATSGKASSRLIRLDMSEYAGFDAVSRLVGSSPAEPGVLIRKVRQQPFTVVLFDEVEKASPDVFDVLLGMFDEGRLTDPMGRVTNFRSTLIIMTSNLGADRQRTVGFNPNGAPRYQDEAMAYFRPEFFNRLDRVVTFQPLKEETIRAITRKELTAIGQRDGLSRLKLVIEWTDPLVDQLAKVGYDARYGARPLQRTIEREVVAPFAKWVLSQENLFGAKIVVDWSDGKLAIHRR